MAANKLQVALVLLVCAIGGAIAMGWFGKSKKGGQWDLENVEPPWEGTVSIYSHIREHIEPGAEGLKEGGDQLPDEKDDGGVKWVAGGLDGAFGHHGGGGSEKARAKMLHRALKVVLEDTSAVKVKKLYEQLLQEGILDYIDPLLERIVEKQDLDVGRLEELALWLAKNAPDREPVKFAIAVLGVIPGSDHSDLLLTLGRHEEFTLYAAVALSNAAGHGGEKKLFELAQHVDGWGRIQIVERLAETNDAEIKLWMLRDGYKNSVMYEYLAYTCAVAGGLRAELEKDRVDPAILSGAADIIQALVTGGPAENMDDYADGAVVVERFLHHLGDEPKEIAYLVGADYIQRFLDEEKADWTARAQRGWTPVLRQQLTARVRAIKALPHWNVVIGEGLASEDDVAFYDAEQAAKAVGIDTWGHQFARLEGGKDGNWYAVMQTDDPARIDRVVALAEKTLPLGELASGPAGELATGPEWAQHSDLGFVLQDLRRFSGKGWTLIRAGVRSPDVRNRYMALRALSAWGMDKWPADAKALLETALEGEPEDGVRKNIETLLAGKQIEKP